MDSAIVKMGRVTILHTYTARESHNISNTNSSKMGDGKNTVFTTQTVLCKAPYSLALLYYVHVQHKRSLPFTHNLASVVKNWLKFSVSATFTLLPLPNLDYVSADEIAEVHVCL